MDELPEWRYDDGTGIYRFYSLDDFDKDCIGFIYHITFKDDYKYIGKKHLYTTKTLKAKKKGPSRTNVIDVIYRNTGKGFRQAYDVIKKESDWLTYVGSAKACKNREVRFRDILAFAYNEWELTYLETKYQFIYEVLEKNDYINDNILGKFYSKKEL